MPKILCPQINKRLVKYGKVCVNNLLIVNKVCVLHILVYMQIFSEKFLSRPQKRNGHVERSHAKKNFLWTRDYL